MTAAATKAAPRHQGTALAWDHRDGTPAPKVRVDGEPVIACLAASYSAGWAMCLPCGAEGHAPAGVSGTLRWRHPALCRDADHPMWAKAVARGLALLTGYVEVTPDPND